MIKPGFVINGNGSHVDDVSFPFIDGLFYEGSVKNIFFDIDRSD